MFKCSKVSFDVNSIDRFKDENGEISRENIKKIIPYGDSFLYIDKVTRLDKKNITATKDVRNDEYWVKGHFANFPIMPGALIVEGLGQAATLLVRYNIENHEQKDILAYKIRSAKFLRPTFPGQTIRFEAKLQFMFKKIALVGGEVYRKEKLVSKVKMVLAIVDKDKFRGRYSGKK
ncbi:hypothetical protein CMO93_04840 [Candidatus Woesearchaeota archaeon]|nr:hypothetical protein [Candidatus Woesearchaeota archaeon]